MIRVAGVTVTGEVGEFRSDDTEFGFKGVGGTTMIHQGTNIQSAKWFEEALIVHLASVFDCKSILRVEGFCEEDREKLDKHFESYFGVRVQRNPAQHLDPATFDALLIVIEESVGRIHEALPGSIRKKILQADLLMVVESVRDWLSDALQGDKQTLNQVFAAQNCERIGRLRLVLDTRRFDSSDRRWADLSELCLSIEAVLKDLGSFCTWQPAPGASETTLQRQKAYAQQQQDHVSLDAQAVYLHPEQCLDAQMSQEGTAITISPRKCSRLDTDDDYPFATPAWLKYPDLEAEYAFDGVGFGSVPAPEVGPQVAASAQASTSSAKEIPSSVVVVDPLQSGGKTDNPLRTLVSSPVLVDPLQSGRKTDNPLSTSVPSPLKRNSVTPWKIEGGYAVQECRAAEGILDELRHRPATSSECARREDFEDASAGSILLSCETELSDSDEDDVPNTSPLDSALRSNQSSSIGLTPHGADRIVGQVVQEGWMLKRSKWLKQWRRRWVVVTPHQLATFKDRHCRRLTEVIWAGSVFSVQSVTNVDGERRVFKVFAHRRNFIPILFTAANASEKNIWMEVIYRTLATST